MDAAAEARAGRAIYVTVSGSFRRHLSAIQDAVTALVNAGWVVLSPADPTIVDTFGEFVFVNSDLRRSIKGVQNRHLEAIRHSAFLWLACPDGYVGSSAAMELGFAAAAGVPVYSDAPPSDWTLRQYVTPVGTVAEAIRAAGRDLPAILVPSEPGLLVAPEAALATVRSDLDRIEHQLLRNRGYRADDPVEETVRRIRRIVTVPAAR